MDALRQRILTLAAALCCAAVFAVAVGELVPAATTARGIERPHVLIDAGHGGMDGGAVAVDGTEEKTINLAVAEVLCDLLRLCGCEVTMTRTTDTALDTVNGATIRENKVADMQARLTLYEQADFTVSLHQNMFGIASCRGSQVFYSENNPLSKRLGTLIRDELIARLQPENERALKAGGKEIYLLYKTTRPAVLVECGFLSNTEELAKLKDPTYQRQLGMAIACGVMRYTKPNGGNEQS